MTATAAALERRRRITLAVVAGCLLFTALGWPAALRLGEGGETRETIAGGVLIAGLVTLIVAPSLIASWRGYMARTLLAALTAGRADLRHISEERQGEAATAVQGPACDLGAFGPTGLVEPFATATIRNALVGTHDGIPFTLAEAQLYNHQGYLVFDGVVGGFALRQACPGLTLVTRERGLLGNLIASLGSDIERVGLEDPTFEKRFEVYGTDQVWCRTVLTTTMLERLVALDQVAHARGLRCAFADGRLLLALSGLHWRAPWWRILLPLGAWLDRYRARLAELVALPAAVVDELALDRQVPGGPARAPRFTETRSWSIGDHAPVVQGRLARLIAGIGMPAIWIASGTLFGGLSLYFGRWVFLEWGVAASGGWQIAGMIVLGALYGAGAIIAGIVMLLRLAWTWNAPLRNLRR